MNGVIVIDKPQGFTSFDVVAVMRRACGQKKIGHTGTLDPMATGVLPLLLGCATRAEPFLDDSGKEYEASFRFGFSTDTEDTTGRVTAQSGVRVTREEILNRIPEFTGEILQTPPMYSAVHKDGKRLYELARQGVEVEREKRPVTITRLELLAFDEESQEGRLAVACSKGTYIRTLCADLALSCGSLGVMSALRRTRAAGFGLDDAVPLEQARELPREELARRVLPVDVLFQARPRVSVSAAQAARFANGGGLSLQRTSVPKGITGGAELRVYAPDGKFLGLGRVDPAAGELRVLRLFPQD